MSLRSAPSRLRAFFGAKPRRGEAPRPIAADRTIYPPAQQVELRFRDGSTKIVDPRSPEAAHLQSIADQLRQTSS